MGGMVITDTDADGVSDSLDNCRELARIQTKRTAITTASAMRVTPIRIRRMYSYLVNSFY